MPNWPALLAPQQATEPFSIKAHADDSPAETIVGLESPKPEIKFGLSWLESDESPAWPWSL